MWWFWKEGSWHLKKDITHFLLIQFFGSVAILPVFWELVYINDKSDSNALISTDDVLSPDLYILIARI